MNEQNVAAIGEAVLAYVRQEGYLDFGMHTDAADVRPFAEFLAARGVLVPSALTQTIDAGRVWDLEVRGDMEATERRLSATEAVQYAVRRGEPMTREQLVRRVLSGAIEGELFAGRWAISLASLDRWLDERVRVPA